MSSNKELSLNDLPEPSELLSANDLPSPEELGMEAPKQDAPGYLESAARGAAQGATFGNADEATAMMESLLGRKSYDQSLAESRANYKAAEDANPLTSLAGNLGGGIASGAALSAVAAPVAGAVGLGKLVGGGAEALTTLDKLKKAAMVGSGMGALNAAGTSDKSLIHDPLALAADTATGAAVGGAGGAALSGLGTTLGKGVDKARSIGAIDDVFNSFNVGKKGVSYFRPADMEKLEDASTKAAADTVESLQQKLSSFGNAKRAMLDQAEKEGKTVDILPLFNKAKTSIEDLTTDEITGADKRKLQSIINALPPELDYNNITPSKVDSIKQLFAKYTKNGDEALKTPEARKIALEMVKALDEQVLNSVDDKTATTAIAGMQKDLGDEVSQYLARAQGQGSAVKTVNKGMSDLMTTQDVLGLDDISGKADKIKATQKLRSMLGRTAADGDGGVNARQTIKELKQVLQNAAPEIADETIGKAEGLADDLYLKKLAKGQIHSGLGNIVGLGNMASVGGSNLAGNMYGAAESLATPGTTAFRVMSKYASKGGDNALSTALDKIANTADDNRRKAMVNTLMQTPYYRQKLQEIQNKIKAIAGSDDDGTETK